MVRMRWNKPIVCAKCGEKSMTRSEKAYHLALKVMLVSGSIAAVFLKFGKLAPFIPVWFPGVAILTFCFSLVVVGFYAYYDRKHSYRCENCFYEMTVPAPPFSFLDKFVLFAFGGALLLMAIGLIVFALTYKGP